MVLRQRYLFISVIFLCFVSIVSAHPPSDMQLFYSPQSGVLNVTITHIVDDPREHYVKDLEIMIDGQNLMENEYSGQPTADRFTYSVPLQDSMGKNVKVSAYCNKFGSIDREMILSSQNDSVSENKTSGFGACIAFLSLLIAGLYFQKK